MRNEQYVFASCGVHFMKSLAEKKRKPKKLKPKTVNHPVIKMSKFRNLEVCPKVKNLATHSSHQVRKLKGLQCSCIDICLGLKMRVGSASYEARQLAKLHQDNLVPHYIK